MRSPKLPPLFAWIGSNRLHRPNSYPIPRSGRISILTFSFLIRLLFDQLQLQLQLQPSAFLFCLTHCFFLKKNKRASASGGVPPLHREWVCISFVLKRSLGLNCTFLTLLVLILFSTFSFYFLFPLRMCASPWVAGWPIFYGTQTRLSVYHLRENVSSYEANRRTRVPR